MNTIHYDNATPAQRQFITDRIRADLGPNQSALVDALLTGADGLISYDDVEGLEHSIEDVWNDMNPATRRGILADCDIDMAPQEAAGYPSMAWDALDMMLNASTLARVEEAALEHVRDNCDLERDIYEWYPVTDWTARDLVAVGEPVLRSYYGTWWGRTCTGQAIDLDPTFWVLYQAAVATVPA